MKPVWQIITDAATQLTNTQNNLMKAVEEVEQQMALQGLYQRALSIMTAQK